MSFCFSPHRWLLPDADGTFVPDTTNPKGFDTDTFRTLVQGQPRLHQLLDHTALEGPLRLGGAVRHSSGATLRVIDFGDLGPQLRGFARDAGFDAPDVPDGPVNRSVLPDRHAVWQDHGDAIDEIVRCSHHHADAAIFV